MSAASFFLFFKNADIVGVTPHLTPKKVLFLQLCTTLLTSVFGGAIMALKGRKICPKRKEKIKENDETKNPRGASLRRDFGTNPRPNFPQTLASSLILCYTNHRKAVAL